MEQSSSLYIQKQDWETSGSWKEGRDKGKEKGKERKGEGRVGGRNSYIFITHHID